MKNRIYIKRIVLLKLAFGCGVCAMQSQTAETPQITVRIKKVENIGGVQKVTDTVINTDDVSKVTLPDGVHLERFAGDSGRQFKLMIVHEKINIEETEDDALPGKTRRRTIVYRDSVSSSGPYRILNVERELGPEALQEIRDMLKIDGGADSIFNHRTQTIEIESPSDARQIMVMQGGDIGKNRTVRKVLFVRLVKVAEATPEERARISGMSGASGEELSVTQLECFPNPANGKFWLQFCVPGGKETDVSVINSEGRAVYEGKWIAANGIYKKEIDLSGHAPGIYFIRIAQGSGTAARKLVIE